MMFFHPMYMVVPSISRDVIPPFITAIYCCSLNSQIIGTTPTIDKPDPFATQGPKGQSAGAWPWSAGRLLVVFELLSTAETTHTAWSQRSEEISTSNCPLSQRNRRYTKDVVSSKWEIKGFGGIPWYTPHTNPSKLWVKSSWTSSSILNSTESKNI